MNFRNQIVLQNDRVLLRPFEPEDVAQLESIVYDEDIWRYMISRISNRQELDTWVQAARTDRAAGQRYTFIIVDRASGSIAGSTAFGNVSDKDKRLEIGWTWLAKGFRGGGLNRQCKFLLLSYAFDVLQYERVELKADALNQRSRKAMLKIGATEEGVLRSHTLMHGGRRRDTIYYGILRHEWPAIRTTIFADLITPTQV